MITNTDIKPMDAVKHINVLLSLRLINSRLNRFLFSWYLLWVVLVMCFIVTKMKYLRAREDQLSAFNVLL